MPAAKPIIALQSVALLALAVVAWHLNAQVAELRARPVEVAKLDPTFVSRLRAIGLERPRPGRRAAVLPADANEPALPEPVENATADVLDRIESLRQHLEYQPSREWIVSLLDACRLEIAALRAY